MSWKAYLYEYEIITNGYITKYISNEILHSNLIHKYTLIKEIDKNYRFKCKLKYIMSYPSRSSVNINWYDEINDIYYISTQEMLNKVIEKDLIRNGYIESEFRFAKRGTKVFITLA